MRHRHFSNCSYWTQSEIAFLKKQWGTGTIEAIGKQIGRTYNAVLAKAMRIKLPRLRGEQWSEADAAALTGYWSKGLSGSQIADLLGKTRCATLGKIRRLDLPRRAPGNQKSREVSPCRTAPVRKLPILVPDPEPGDRIPFLELEPHHCRWPMWNEGEAHLFCGRNREPGKPYCSSHQSIAIGTGKPKGVFVKFPRAA